MRVGPKTARENGDYPGKPKRPEQKRIDKKKDNGKKKMDAVAVGEKRKRKKDRKAFTFLKTQGKVGHSANL